MNLKREFSIFLTIFVVLSILMHFDSWISAPLEHLKALSSHSMPYHPLLYVAIVYTILLILRGFIKLIKKIFSR